MKRIYGLIAITILASALLIGCGPGTVKDALIKADIANEFSSSASADHEIQSVNVERRQTNKDAKTELVVTKVVYTNNIAEYTSFYELSYKYFDQGGWHLESFEGIDRNLWNAVPIAGMPDEDINIPSPLPIKNNFNLKQEDLVISPQQEILDLTEGTDVKTFNVNKANQFYKIYGTINVTYDFDAYKGSWAEREWTLGNDFKLEWDLLKTWNGIMRLVISKYPFELEITKVADDGTIEGVITTTDSVSVTGTVEKAGTLTSGKDLVHLNMSGTASDGSDVTLSANLNTTTGNISGISKQRNTTMSIDLNLQ